MQQSDGGEDRKKYPNGETSPKKVRLKYPELRLRGALDSAIIISSMDRPGLGDRLGGLGSSGVAVIGGYTGG